MKNRIVTSVLVGSLVFTPLAGVSTVWADGTDTSSSESQTTTSELFDSGVEMSDSLVKLDELSDESMEVLSSEDVLESESTLKSNETAATNESTVESTEEVQYEDVYYNGQWFQFPIQEEPAEPSRVDENANHELGTFVNPTSLMSRSVVDVISETQSGRPDWDFIDVASYQGNLSISDYQFMQKHGVTGVVVKLTQGTSYKNPYAANQIKNALAAGMKVSTYHFSHFTTKEGAEAEATYYAKMAKELGLSGTTVMVNDLETNFNDFSTQNSVYFANKLKELGYPITLHYSSSSIFDRNILSTAILGLQNLWVAQYPYQPSDKNILHTARSAWQWSDSMEFTEIKDSSGKRKRFDINMDHNGMLSNKFLVSDEVVEDVIKPAPPQEKTINRYATVTKKGYSVWNNLSFTGENAKSDNYFQNTLYVEKEYTFSDGTVVVSLKDSQGKLLGYVDPIALSYGNNKGGSYLSDGRYVTIRSKNYTIWQNLNFSKTKNISSTYYNQTLQAKGRYNHFNGSTYYSLYSNNGTWLGYINATGVKVGAGKQGAYQSYGKYVTIKSNSYAIWRNFGWSSKASGSFAGKTYLAKGIYNHFNGSRYLSLYDSKGKWLGYINEKGANVANNKGGVALAAKFNKNVVKRNYTIWQNLNFTKAKANSNQYLNQTLYVKVKYNHYNNSTYYSLYNANNQWLGYINQNATK